MPSMSEEELFSRPLTMEELIPMLGATTVPPERREQQGIETALAVLGMLPVIGNAMSAYDATETGESAWNNLAAGNYRTGAIDAGLTGLNAAGAVLGLPFGKAAGRVAKAGKDTANVFIPAVDDAATDAARELRAGHAKPSTIHRKTGRVIVPEGKFLEEISDRPMTLNAERIKPGHTMLLSKLADHPELFDHFPQYRDTPVEFGRHIPGKPSLAVASTKPDGTMLLPVNNEVKGNLAKLLQYDLNNKHGLAGSVRHAYAGGREAFAKSAESAAKMPVEAPGDLRAMAAYLEAVNSVKAKSDMFMNKGMTEKAARIFGDVSAGNALAHRAKVRANATEHSLKSQPHIYGDKNFEELVPLIPEGASPAQVQDFLRSWHTLGAGVGRTPTVSLAHKHPAPQGVSTTGKSRSMDLLKVLNALEGKNR